jgi:NAD(P)-dependent dehydrogenase (short-subunit alcohol dehydrogenase family)
MAIDHGPEGIRVNCVCPGPTDTPLLEPYFAASSDPAGERRAYEAMQLHGRLVTADEIAGAVAYLAAPGASSTMGAALVVDGGYVVR